MIKSRLHMRAFIVSTIMILIMSMSMSVTAFAEESGTETNLLSSGVIVYDAEGNVVYQPNFTIGEGVVVPAGGTMACTKDCWYDGGKMTFYASISDGTDVEYLGVSIWSPKFYATDLGSFSQVNGQSWYGKLGVYMDNVYLIDPGKYYKYALTNTFGHSIRVDSFTAIDD
ncbi:hypothetical protein [Clostridium aminobutyricum]|uniref:Uncharacterized protein n=1 Tax=Clostridium aminobutyricum TaxID=33953 RepID=A0A939IFY7_CLOAM|nr:hypothetical protein [Clostridium aminobutyricum]MBN7772195.1 hypothetical protein [Clostridium aminobutyricum]